MFRTASPSCQPQDPARLGQPPDQASHPTLPATPPCSPPHPARHPTRPATHPAGLPSLTALPASSATTASLALWRANAVLVLLQRLCEWGASQRETPSNILHNPSNILSTPSKILRTPSKILCTPPNILRKSFLWCCGHPICTALAPRRGVNCGVESPFFVKTWRGTMNMLGCV